VLWKAGGNYLTSAQAGTLAATIVAAGWGHPDDLTDEQVVGIKNASMAPLDKLGSGEHEHRFRAALARAFKGEA